jgi:hypothetical protein
MTSLRSCGLSSFPVDLPRDGGLGDEPYLHYMIIGDRDHFMWPGPWLQIELVARIRRRIHHHLISYSIQTQLDFTSLLRLLDFHGPARHLAHHFRHLYHLTSSSTYPGSSKKTPASSRSPAEKDRRSPPRSSAGGKSSSSSTADKRRRDESKSPAEVTRKKSAKGSAGEVVAAAEREWERKPNKLRVELSDLREKHRKLEGEFGSAKSRWEGQRIQLVADEAKYKARAHQSSKELKKIQAERETWLAEREELVAERDSLLQLAELQATRQATLDTDTKALREGAETAAS